MEKLQPYQMTQAARAILDNRQAMEALLKEERIVRVGWSKEYWYEMKGGNLFNQDGKPVGVAFTPGDKWRIATHDVKELSFMEAVQIPGTWQHTKTKLLMKVNENLHVFMYHNDGTQESQPHLGVRFWPPARYVRIGDA